MSQKETPSGDSELLLPIAMAVRWTFCQNSYLRLIQLQRSLRTYVNEFTNETQPKVEFDVTVRSFARVAVKRGSHDASCY